MPSETDLLNDALGQIGATRITAIDDGSVNANWCGVFYTPLRQALLRAHHWNFAEGRIELAQNVVKPAFEFAFAYALPADLLKIKEYNGALLDVSAVDPLYWMHFSGYYKIEGRDLLTNDGEVKIVYVKDITNPTLWDSLFYQAFGTHLASKLATAIRKDHALSESLMRQAQGILMPLAMAVDGQEGTITPYRVDELLWGR